MIEIAICDDHVEICKAVHKLIMELLMKRDIDIDTHIYTTGSELLKADTIFDILFLDIELEKENGMEIAKKYPHKKETRIIFLTSHTEEMSNGYKVRAFRFLTKPIDEEALFEALIAAIMDVQNDIKICVIEDGEERYVHVSEIIYIDAHQRSTGVSTVSGYAKSRLMLEDMKKELALPQFYSPHRSFIVNMDHIKQIDSLGALLSNGERIKISRLKLKEFKQIFYSYLRGKTNGI